MQQEDIVRKKILTGAGELFFKQGIKGITMDMVANYLHMSKRTLYQVFDDKEELLIACYQNMVDTHNKIMQEALYRTDDVLEVVLLHFRLLLRRMSSVSPKFFEEISKYPALVEYIHESRQSNFENAIAFLQKGVEQGLLRGDVNYEIFIKSVMMEKNTEEISRLTENFPPSEIFFSTVFISMRGCATEKGVARLDKFLHDYKENDQLKE